MAERRTEGYRSGDALFEFDEELRILSWNRAAEELVGIQAEDAIGRRCWEVLGGTEEDGAMVCHPGCSYARLAREGWPVACHDLLVKTVFGPRRVALSTIAVPGGDRRRFLHLMRSAPRGAPEGTTPRGIRLTPRELQVLELLADGLTPKRIAARLGIALATVRNHIRGIRLELGSHSQLEAVARARREGLLQR